MINKLKFKHSLDATYPNVSIQQGRRGPLCRSVCAHCGSVFSWSHMFAAVNRENRLPSSMRRSCASNNSIVCCVLRMLLKTIKSHSIVLRFDSLNWISATGVTWASILLSGTQTQTHSPPCDPPWTAFYSFMPNFPSFQKHTHALLNRLVV